MSNTIFILLIIFQIKHYLADYPWQNEYMLGKFKEKGWILPLAAHAGVHAVFTFVISILFVAQWPAFHIGLFNYPRLMLLFICLLIALFDFVVHFTMDRIKASPKMLGRHKALSKSDFVMIQHDFKRYKMDSDTNIANLERIKSNKKFWKSLGIDQMVHHLTHYIIIFTII